MVGDAGPTLAPSVPWHPWQLLASMLVLAPIISMLANNCQGCHGTDGASVGPASPTIAGLSKDYFVEVMEGFASGDVKATIMDRIAKGYNKKEI